MTTTTKEALEPCPLAHEVREGVNLWSSSAGQKWHIWCYDCGLQFEGRLNQLKDEVIKAWNSRSAPIAPVVDTNNAAYSCERYAEMIESQNDLSGQTENWQDFHRGQHYAAKQLADAFRSAPASTVAPQQSDEDVDYFDPVSLLEKAMRTTMEIQCDCPRESGFCDGECVGSRLWQLIHRARKLIRSAPASPAALRDEVGKLNK